MNNNPEQNKDNNKDENKENNRQYAMLSLINEIDLTMENLSLWLQWLTTTPSPIPQISPIEAPTQEPQPPTPEPEPIPDPADQEEMNRIFNRIKR